MAQLTLRIPKSAFVAGEEVNGKVFLTTEKEIKCKSFRVVIEGLLTAKGSGFETTGKGRTTQKTYTQTFAIHQEEIMLAQETAFDPGTQKFEFQFKLPEDAKVSYDGHNGSIKYAILALMDVSWKAKLDASMPIMIIQSVDEFPDEVTKEVAEHEGEEILEVEIDSQKYCIGNKISFRYRVNTDMKFNQLKAQIEHTENTTLKGKTPMSHTKVLWEKQIVSDDIVRHEWNKWILNINKNFPPWFKYENIQSGIRLKVTIGRSFRFDKSAEIPLVSGYCLGTIGSAEGDVNIVAPIKKSRRTRLRCNACSYTFKLKDDDVDFGTCPSCGKPVYF